MANTRSFTIEEIIKATLEDEELNHLKNALLRGHFRANETASKIFAKVFNELLVSSDSLVLRGLRIVLPQALRPSAVKLAHEGHQGICKTKSLLRAKIWFPGIDVMVEEKARLCRECQVNGEKVRPEPLRMTQMYKR